MRDLVGIFKIVWQFLLGAIYWGMWKEQNKTILKSLSQERFHLGVYWLLIYWALICIDFDDLEWFSVWDDIVYPLFFLCFFVYSPAK